ncbi:YycH protein [Aneurinibacillus aneurinilyticus ATCC 12856]|uniref:YycH protein n=2 Tax=Aneurinibacillus aneurinilyticus TaxID=1391 RepID=U1Y1M8_ANEAE|nr:YycH protein [Aneurinibacillus aneurinilyticus ATCC 12856]
MKMKLERLKTLILISLISLSLILSGLLWNSAPQLDSLTPADYVASHPVGHKYEVTDVIYPSSIMLHVGDGKHMKANIESAMYKRLRAEMDKWYLYDFAKIKITKEEWEGIINKKKTVEIIYKHEIPTDIASELFNVRGRFPDDFRSVSRIVLYENKEQKAVHALLLSDRSQQIIQAHTSMIPEEMTKLFVPANLDGLSEQILFRTFAEKAEDNDTLFYQPVYVPKGREKMWRYRYFYQPLTVQQVLDAMFVDASMARQITERDGTMIYTNGSQSVSIPGSHDYLLYRHPTHEWESQSSERANYEALSSVLSFVNQHGGWTGRYYLESVSGVDAKSQEEAVAYRFRQYVGPYPLFSMKGTDLNIISARISGGNVSELFYPMRQLDLYFERVPVVAVSGEELIKWLENKEISKQQVVSVELGLYTRRVYDFIEMKPCWAIHLTDRDPLYVAADVEGFGK